MQAEITVKGNYGKRIGGEGMIKLVRLINVPRVPYRCRYVPVIYTGTFCAAMLANRKISIYKEAIYFGHVQNGYYWMLGRLEWLYGLPCRNNIIRFLAGLKMR